MKYLKIFKILALIILINSSFEAREKKILIINSFSADIQWTKIINAGIIGAFRKELPSCKFYYENLDAYFLNFDETIQKKSKEFTQKYKGENFDLIICVDFIAAEILLKLKATIFQNVPAIFTGINFYEIENLKKFNNIYIINNYLPFKETIRLIQNFHLPFENLVLFTDGSLFSERLRQEVYEALENFEHLNIISININQIVQMGIEGIEIPDNSACFVLSIDMPQNLKTISRITTVDLVAKSFGNRIPIYTIFSIHVGKGALGGKALSPIAYGKAAGILGLKILFNENIPQNFAEVYNVSKFYFDYRKLLEFKVELTKIPNGSSIISIPQPKKIPVKEGTILFFAIAFIFISLLIILLLVYNRKLIKLKNQLELDQARFKTLATNASAITLVYNKNYELVFSNYYLEKTTGHSILELANLKTTQILDNIDLNKLLSSIDYVLENDKELKNIEIAIIARNNEKRYFFCSISPVRLSYIKKQTFALLTLTEITEIKRIAAALQEQNDFIEDIINSLKDPFFVVEVATKKILLSNSSCNLPTNYQEMTCCDIINEGLDKCDYYNNPYCPLAPFILEGKKNAWGRFAPFKYINSGYYDFNYSPVYKSDGTLEKVIIYAAEATDKISKEEKIKKLTMATEENPSAVVIVSKEGLIEYVNKSFERISGFTAKEAIGQSLKKEFNPVFFFKGSDKLWSKLKTQSQYRMEILNRRKNLDEYWEEIQGVAIAGDDNEPMHFIIIKQDINYRKILESELIKAKIEAEKSDKLKSEFLAQMSHEIRTPVNAIVSFSSFLRDELKDKVDEELSIAFEALNNGSKRLIRTIELILDMAQLQSGAYKAKYEPTNIVKDIIMPVIQEYENSFKRNNLYLKFSNLTKRELIFPLDRYSIKQTFIQIIDNASKYTRKGGAEIVVYDKADTIVAVDIKDTGIGISEDYLPHLFKVFSQEERGYTRTYEGNGLGLALAKKFAQINNADIKVSTKKGEGSVFTVEFYKLL